MFVKSMTCRRQRLLTNIITCAAILRYCKVLLYKHRHPTKCQYFSATFLVILSILLTLILLPAYLLVNEHLRTTTTNRLATNKADGEAGISYVNGKQGE